MAVIPKLDVEMIGTELLIPYAGNAKEHPEWQVEQIANSIEQFGFDDPIAYWTNEDGQPVIVEGHGRLLAAQLLGIDTVPCIALDHLDDEARRAYTLVHNKLTTNTGYDEDMLAAELASIGEIDMSDFGFPAMDTLEDLEHIEEDEAPEPDFDEPPVAQPGQIWQLGKHRLMCGDSTKQEDVDKLLDGISVDMVSSDPPYRMGKDIKNDSLRKKEFSEFNKKWIDIAFDAIGEYGAFWVWGNTKTLMEMWADIIRPMEDNHEAVLRNLCRWRKPAVIGENYSGTRMFKQSGEDCLLLFKGREEEFVSKTADDFFEGYASILDWLSSLAETFSIDGRVVRDRCGKNMFSHWFSRSQWNFMSWEDFDLLFPDDEWNDKTSNNKSKEYKNKRDEWEKQHKELEKQHEKWMGQRTPFDATRCVPDLIDRTIDTWDCPSVLKDRPDHPTVKPVRLISIQIVSCTVPGQSVFEPFGGSGTTLIAAEQTGRVAYLMELDPHYCDVIIERYENMTGDKAVLLNGAGDE